MTAGGGWRLEVVRGPGTGRSWPLPVDADVVIGRDPDSADVIVPAAVVSRSHASVRVTGGGVVLEDVGSMNGTYLGAGERLEPGAPAPVEAGALFHLAHAGIALRVTGPAHRPVHA